MKYRHEVRTRKTFTFCVFFWGKEAGLPKALLRAVKDDLVHKLDSHHFQFGVRIPARPEQQIEGHLDQQQKKIQTETENRMKLKCKSYRISIK
jgi:hypothetical protein